MADYADELRKLAATLDEAKRELNLARQQSTKPRHLRIRARRAAVQAARVVAATDCRLAALSPQLFDRLVTEQPTVARKVMLRLTRIIRACDERIMDLSTLRAVERVAVEILRLARPVDGGAAIPGSWVVDRLPAQRDIAARVGTARETVARVLSQLQDDGVVERRGRMLVVPDRMRLLRVAAGDRPEALLAR